VSNMKEFHKARILRQLQREFRTLGKLVTGFEKRLEKDGEKRKLDA